jgi:hypothetical protein
MKLRGGRQNQLTQRDNREATNHVSWLLNVSGDFGSQQFEFSSKQKRDECRSMLFMATRRLGNTSRGSSDFNFDGYFSYKTILVKCGCVVFRCSSTILKVLNAYVLALHNLFVLIFIVSKLKNSENQLLHNR